mgnify:FL=1
MKLEMMHRVALGLGMKQRRALRASIIEMAGLTAQVRFRRVRLIWVAVLDGTPYRGWM